MTTSQPSSKFILLNEVNLDNDILLRKKRATVTLVIPTPLRSFFRKSIIDLQRDCDVLEEAHDRSREVLKANDKPLKDSSRKRSLSDHRQKHDIPKNIKVNKRSISQTIDCYTAS